MATRFSVPLAHAGCDHTGSVVWEQRRRGDAAAEGAPAMVGLPRGFVSLNAEDGAIEIVCTGCRQTVASAARGAVLAMDASADPAVEAAAANAADPAAGEPATRDEAPGNHRGN
jgi:hypothetical protein